MKLNEFKQLIREEVRKVLNEESYSKFANPDYVDPDLDFTQDKKGKWLNAHGEPLKPLDSRDMAKFKKDVMKIIDATAKGEDKGDDINDLSYDYFDKLQISKMPKVNIALRKMLDMSGKKDPKLQNKYAKNLLNALQ